MLRAAFMLAALGAAAAQHDEAGRVHEHDERRHDDKELHDPRHLITLPHIWRIGTNLISCQQLQAMPHEPCEDDKYAENERARHDGTDWATRHGSTGMHCSKQLLQNQQQIHANCWWMVHREHDDFLDGTTTSHFAHHVRGATQCSRDVAAAGGSNATAEQQHHQKATMAECWCRVRCEFGRYDAATKTNSGGNHDASAAQCPDAAPTTSATTAAPLAW